MNAKKLIIFPILFIVMALFAQEANLTMRPVAKSKYNVEVNSLMDIKQNMGGMEVKVNGSSVAKAVLEIEEVASNGNFTVLSTWKEMKSTTSAMGQDTTMNFENLNLQMRTVYDKTGKVLKNERVDKSTSSDPGLAMVEQVATGMKFPILSAQATKKGDSWKSNTNDTIKTPGSPFSMIIDMEEDYSYAGIENECHRINASGPIKVSGQGSEMGMDMNIEGTGMNEAYSLHNTHTLIPSLMEGKMGLDMNIMVAGAQSMAIPMTQNVTTKIILTEIK